MTDLMQPTGVNAVGYVDAWRKSLSYAGIILLAALMIYPLVWMVSNSFKPDDEIFSSVSLIPGDPSVSAYPRGWDSMPVSFSRFFLNSAVIAILSVVGNVLSCSLTAFAFARLKFRGRDLWFALMLATLMMPQHAVLIPQYVLFLNLGWINTILPLVVPKFLAVDAFFIFLMVQFFRSIPRELDEAATIDGCGPWRIYFKIILPLSMPVLATASIFSFIWTWDDFFAPLVYLNDMDNYTVQLGLRGFVDSTSGQSDWSALFAMSTLALVPIFILFLFFQKLLIEGVATTGMKR